MAKGKKKLLPKDFQDLVRNGSIDELKAVFDLCDVDAGGGYTKQTALAFHGCPDELTRWLVARGADVNARDTYGATPLHSRARHWQGQIAVLIELGADIEARDGGGMTPLHCAATGGNPDAVRAMLDRSAEIDAVDNRGRTPLLAALQECQNANIAEIAAVAELLLAVPPPRSGIRALVGSLFRRPTKSGVTPEMQALVKRIGENFEFYRANFNKDLLEATSAGLDRLYTMFNVTPVPRRIMHDGVSPIIAASERWEDQQAELWALLVPPSGAARTVQGEVIRIAGRIQGEIHRNGGGNWDADYNRMGAAFLQHIGSGAALSPDDQKKAKQCVAEVRRRDEAAEDLCELAVKWVSQNPQPVALAPPDYGR